MSKFANQNPATEGYKLVTSGVSGWRVWVKEEHADAARRLHVDCLTCSHRTPHKDGLVCDSPCIDSVHFNFWFKEWSPDEN